ncbi:MAG TPA: YbhB/YbcL family Raf kinase inhibitor-like protein [Lacunisphaera sp.]
MSTSFQLASPSFGNDQPIPARHTCEGEGTSPELAWSEPPKGAKGFALSMHDPDAPKGDFTHWLLWDIPVSETSLAEGSGLQSSGATGSNSRGDVAYFPPAPPPGDPPHRYIFELYALDVATLGLPRGSPRDEFEAALASHVLAGARLTGRFGRTSRQSAAR